MDELIVDEETDRLLIAVPVRGGQVYEQIRHG